MLASGPLASSQVYPCHAFPAFFMRLFLSLDENLVFVRLLLGLSAVVVVGQFTSFPLVSLSVSASAAESSTDSEATEEESICFLRVEV